MAYPTSYDNIPTVSVGDLITAGQENLQSGAINAIETALGLTPYGANYSTVGAALAALGSRSAVRLATAAALPTYTVSTDVLTASANGALSVDGIAVASNDRVVVKNETGSNQPNNGIYVVTATGDGSHPWVLTRAADMSYSDQVPGATVYVQEGNTNAGIVFGVIGATSSFTLGTTDMAWQDVIGSHALSWQAARLGTISGLGSYTQSDNILTATGDGALSVDSVTASVNDRILVKNETGAQEPFNGLYTVTATGSGSAPWVLTRVTDMSNSTQVEGTTVFVREGDTLAGTFWVNTNQGGFTLNSTNVAFAQLAGPPQSSVSFNGQALTNGIWEGTTIAIAYGGTGATTAAAAFNALSPMTTSGDIIYGGASGAATRLAANSTSTNKYLQSVSSGTPTWQQVAYSDLSGSGSTNITTVGTITSGAWNASLIPLAYGGTSADLTASNGGIVYSTSSAMAILAGTSTADQILLSGASGAPAWSTATYPATTTANQLLYSSSNNTIAGLATADNGVLITSGSGVPSISSTLPTAVQGNITSTGTVTSGTWQGSKIGLAYGGTNADLTASNGGILYSTSSAMAILAGTSTADQILLSGASGAPAWSTATYPATTTANQLLYSSSNNTVAGLATADNGVLITNGSGVPSISSTLPSAVQGNITSAGTIASGTWEGTSIGVAYGGTGIASATAYAVLCGGTTSTGALQSVASVGTSGQVLTSSGSGALPTFQTITSTGTITSGTWEGTAVGVAYGGTGVASTTAYAVLCGGTTSTGALQSVASVGTSGQVLTSNGSGALPTFQAITSTGTITSGTWEGSAVGLAYGGTNADLAPSNGGIVYSTSSAMAILAGTSTAKQILMSGASTTPSWSTATYPSTITADYILYGSGTNAIGSLPLSSNLQINGSTQLDTIQGIQTTSTPQFAALGINTASASPNKLLVFYPGASASGIGIVDTSEENGSEFLRFYVNTDVSGDQQGSVSYVEGTGVSFNATSDRRLKENITVLGNALERLNKIVPREFTFKKHPNKAPVMGFIADELQQVVPQAVTGTPGEMDENGDPKYQQIDYSKVTPLLTAAIQELYALVNERRQP